MLTTLLAFALALGILITFHELGHYWVARWCGVRVLRFSVGFGRVVLRRTDKHGTEWALSAIPLGGYVKMLDDPQDLPDAKTGEAFQNKTVWQRIAIVAAGPLANLLLAVLLYAALGWLGTQQPAAVLGAPPAGSAAALAGVQAQDRVLAVNGREVQSWGEVRWQLLALLGVGGNVRLDVQSGDGRVHALTLPIAGGNLDDLNNTQTDFLEEAGLRLQPPRTRIAMLSADGGGAASGLQRDDVILMIAGHAVPDPRTFAQTVQAWNDPHMPPLATVVQRGDEVLALQLTPDVILAGDEGIPQGLLGVSLQADFPTVRVRYGALAGLWHGGQRTVETFALSLRMMARMVTGEVSVKNISGPVTIADYAGQTARMGWAAYLGFLALISVSLGLLNLLPIPMLDGGHLLWYLVEIVRGKPVPESWMLTGQWVGGGLLAALMGLAFFNDLTRLLG